MVRLGTALNNGAAALIAADASAKGASVPPQWLMDLKAAVGELREGRERPAGKPPGRWLGDFLNQDTQSGLLPAEEKLLFAAVNGEACVLEGRAAFLWTAFEAWRETDPRGPKGDLTFVEAIAKFTEAAPEPVQHVIIEATRYAIEKLRLPAYWEPRNAADVQMFALTQRAFLARLEADAHPKETIERARTDTRFYQLAVEAAIKSLTLRSQEPLKPYHEWLNPLVLRDPIKVSAGMRAKIDEEPRVLRGFFEDLLRDARRAARADKDFTDALKADPDVLTERFDAVFSRYERERWRWIDPEDADVQVRAGFLRFLALSGDEIAPVHDSRLELHGAYVEDDLDLSSCAIPRPLSFRRSCFAGRISLRDVVAKSLTFSTSCVRSIDAEGARIEGGVFLDNGFRAKAGISFAHAAIDRRLSCGAGTFLANGKCALDFNRAKIGGDAALNDGFRSEGGAFFKKAKIEGDLTCDRGVFLDKAEEGSAPALCGDHADIGGDVSLANGFRSEGSVSFFGAKIDGALNCKNASFFNPTQDGAGRALDFATAEAKGDAFLCDGFSACGEVSFRAARIRGDLACAGGRFDNSASAKPNGKLRRRLRRDRDKPSGGHHRGRFVVWRPRRGGGRKSQYQRLGQA